MRGVIVLLLLGLGGCASPSFTGRWNIENPPGLTQASMLDLHKDGTYAATTRRGDGSQQQFSGTWTTTSKTTATLTQQGGQGAADATLIGKQQLQLVLPNDPETYYFKRQR
jgi:hypothetical protein